MEDTDICAICGIPVVDHGWGVYFDPEYKRNVWGGDTFESRGLLCAACVNTLMLNKEKRL